VSDDLNSLTPNHHHHWRSILVTQRIPFDHELPLTAGHETSKQNRSCVLFITDHIYILTQHSSSLKPSALTVLTVNRLSGHPAFTGYLSVVKPSPADSIIDLVITITIKHHT